MAAKEPSPPNSSCQTCEKRHENTFCMNPDIMKEVEKARLTCHFKPGQYIFHAGNTPLGLFTISSGTVKIESVSPNGHTHTLRLMGAGANLGYRSLFANEPYQASAIAVDDCVLCFIPRSEAMIILQNHPEVMLRLLEKISKDLRLAEQKWINQMSKGVAGRVAEALLFLNRHFQSQTWTRRDIAEWAGTSPETVIRTLAQFEKEGLIDQKSGRSIKILKPEDLQDRTEN